MNCSFCDQPVIGHTTPPMCEKHLDLSVICEYQHDRNLPLTVEAIRDLVALCRERNGNLKLLVEDVETFLTDEFAARFPPAAPEMEVEDAQAK